MARRGIRRIRPFRRYLRRQVSISCCSLMHRRKHPEMGPCLRRGLRGSVFLSHKHRFPGACRGLLQKLRGASRARFRHPPESRGEETVFPHASSPTRSVWGPISERCPRNVLRGEGIAGVQCPSLIWRRPVMPPRPPMRSGVTPGVQTAPYPVISNHKSFQCGLRSVIRLILFFRR